MSDFKLHMYVYLTVTSTEGSDFNLRTRSISFPAGVTRVTFNVTITEDSVLEPNENITVGINPITVPSTVTIGSFNNTTITILNDDSK